MMIMTVMSTSILMMMTLNFKRLGTKKSATKEAITAKLEMLKANVGNEGVQSNDEGGI